MRAGVVTFQAEVEKSSTNVNTIKQRSVVTHAIRRGPKCAALSKATPTRRFVVLLYRKGLEPASPSSSRDTNSIAGCPGDVGVTVPWSVRIPARTSW